MAVPDAPAASGRLFKPLKVGNVELAHRIALAPLTRNRGTDDLIPSELNVSYYSQRASVPGTLLITEASFISARHTGYPNVPGLWSDEQSKEWKKVTDAVHAKGSYIYAQLWAMGRTQPGYMAAKYGGEVVSSSANKCPQEAFFPGIEAPEPKELSIPEIKEVIQEYVQAAKNAVEKGGFDGVEIHGANGYLVDQFIQDVVNTRTDEYGGSIENRNRFAIELVQAIAAAVGANRVAIRLSPWSRYQAMRMADPKPQFLALVKELKKVGLAYLHLVQARVDGNQDNDDADGWAANNFIIDEWANSTPIVLAGGYKADNGADTVDKHYPDKDVVIAYGRWFISNPDLVYRIRKGLELSPYVRDLFYAFKDPNGYTTYDFSSEFKVENPVAAS